MLSVERMVGDGAGAVCAALTRRPGLIALQVGFELPEKIQAYVADFMATCPSKAFLEAHDGFMASKLA